MLVVNETGRKQAGTKRRSLSIDPSFLLLFSSKSNLTYNDLLFVRFAPFSFIHSATIAVRNAVQERMTDRRTGPEHGLNKWEIG